MHIVETLHGLVNLTANWTIGILLAGGLAAIAFFVGVFRSDFERPD